jgi:hypothetical protein
MKKDRHLQFLWTTTVRVPIHRKVPCANGIGFTTREIGQRVAECDVFIDMAALKEIAERSATNKSKRAKQGAVLVKMSESADVIQE